MPRSIRLLPPAPPTGAAAATTVANGRTYSCAPGSFLDVPDHDAGVLEANGWTKIALVGPTSARPSARDADMLGSPPRGMHFYDTTVGALLTCDAAGVWRSPTGAAV